MPSPALLLPCNPLLLSQRFRAQARLPLRDRTSLTPDAGLSRARASDILLTQDANKIGLGWACRAEPGSGGFGIEVVVDDLAARSRTGRAAGSA
jgi:hypothetical protein